MQGKDEVWAVLVIRDHAADCTFLAEQQEGRGCWRETDRQRAVWKLGGRSQMDSTPLPSRNKPAHAPL
jgi:hypothetical protein